MFNLDLMEVVLVLLVAFLVVGPKELPRVARWIARMVKKAKVFIQEVKKEIGWDDIIKDITSTADDVKGTMKDADIAGELRRSKEDMLKSFSSVRDDIKKTDTAFLRTQRHQIIRAPTGAYITTLQKSL